MAATGSDNGGRGHALSALSRRLTLRLRLTLLYGVCFLLGAAAVLAVTYGIVAHDTSSQTRHLHVYGAPIKLPVTRSTVVSGRSGAVSTPSPSRESLTIEQIQIFPNGKENITWTPSQSTKLAKGGRNAAQGTQGGLRYSAAQLAKIQTGALAMSRCMRAHGLNYPDLGVSRGPGGHGFEVGFSRSRHVSPVELEPPGFSAANIRCSRLLNRDVPSATSGGPKTERIASSVQKQVNVIVDRANGALTTQRSSLLRTLLTWSGVALGVMALISIVLGWLMGGRALKPLRIMTSRARRITEENLHERLSVNTQEDELGELATTFDDVLARLERAFAAQKRFVANASHELRTPVTLERALLEIALARSQGGTDVDAPVDLADLARDAITLREQRADGITIATDLHPAPLNGDPALLERLVANLIDNAISHNVTEDGWINIETGHDGADSWLRVSNSGPEVPEAMIAEIFEPFRRMNGERTATATGVGLGLSIVQAIADVHGAAVETSPVEGGGLRVEVRF